MISSEPTTDEDETARQSAINELRGLRILKPDSEGALGIPPLVQDILRAPNVLLPSAPLAPAQGGLEISPSSSRHQLERTVVLDMPGTQRERTPSMSSSSETSSVKPVNRGFPCSMPGCASVLHCQEIFDEHILLPHPIKYSRYGVSPNNNNIGSNNDDADDNGDGMESVQTPTGNMSESEDSIDEGGSTSQWKALPMMRATPVMMAVMTKKRSWYTTLVGHRKSKAWNSVSMRTSWQTKRYRQKATEARDVVGERGKWTAVLWDGRASISQTLIQSNQSGQKNKDVVSLHVPIRTAVWLSRDER